MRIENLLQKINQADYENLEKVVISVKDLLLLRSAIKDRDERILGLETKLSLTETKLYSLVGQRLKTYKELSEL